ncbi:glycosyl-phosphatidylinositol-anchored molecule-like protein [Tenrec ecaudatus]|uniref:glycosyl-phosphatidylinositol-anchored molecule-like protein n=1 Tax=Tenrec ecaudatus TaxID=94439 RepID=UPI003F59316B
MTLLVLLMVVGLPLGESSLTRSMVEANVTEPPVETNFSQALMKTILAQPLVENKLTLSLMETSVNQSPVETSVNQSLVETSLNQSLVEPRLLVTFTPGGPSRWSFNVSCHACTSMNNFACPRIIECPYHTRRCMIVSIRLNRRQLLVWKDCAFNCSFVYPSEQPPETPRKITTDTSLYFVQCCQGSQCNRGGPTNFERDMIPYEPIEEELPEGAVCLGPSAFALSLVSIIISDTLT